MATLNVVKLRPAYVSRKFGPKNARGLFQVDVDDTSVRQILGMVDMAVSPPGLAVFLSEDVRPLLVDEIVERFAYNGTGGMNWAPLAEATLRIRQAMGQTDDWAINDRTGQLLNHLIAHADVDTNANLTSLAIPGSTGMTEVIEEKIRTAQEGKSEFNPLFGMNTSTPARPVLALTADDRAAIVILLQMHVMQVIAGFY